MVSIITQWPGHSAEEVERLITVPIEREMNGIPKENNLRSVSLYALSDVDITFDQDTDRNFARQQVFNRLGRPRLAERRHARRRAADLAVRADLPLRAAKPGPLADGAQDVRGLDGRAAISSRCPASPTIPASAAGRCSIRCCSTNIASPARACRRSRSRARSAPTTATPAADSTPRAGSSTTSAASAGFETLEDIGNVVVAVHDGMPMLVKDVGQVTIGIAPRLGQFGFDKQNDAVEGVIMLRTGEKTQDVLKGVEAKTQELNTQHPAQGREGRSLLRPLRPRPRDHASPSSTTCCAACCSSS